MRIFTQTPMRCNRISIPALILLLVLISFSALQAQDCDPPAFAGENDTICGLSHTLYGNYQGGNWSLLCDSLDGLVDTQLLLDDAMQVTVSNSGDYQFIYTYEDNCFSSDTIQLQFCAPHASGISGNAESEIIVEGNCNPPNGGCSEGESSMEFPVENPTATVSISVTNLSSFYDYQYAEVSNIQADTCLADINILSASNTQFSADENWVGELSEFFDWGLDLDGPNLPSDYFDDICDPVCSEVELTVLDLELTYVGWWTAELVNSSYHPDSLYVTFVPDSINPTIIECWELLENGDIVEGEGQFNISWNDEVVIDTLSNNTSIVEACGPPCTSTSGISIPIPEDPNFECSFVVTFGGDDPDFCDAYYCDDTGEYLEYFDYSSCTCIYEYWPPFCDDNDCNTEDFWDGDFCGCVNTPIPPPDCDDDCQFTTDSYDVATCACINILLPPDCDDDCQFTTDSYDVATCACTNILLPPDCDDDCQFTTDSYDVATCACTNILLPPDCDDNICETLDSFDNSTCSCINEWIIDCGSESCPSTTDVPTTENIASGNTPNLPTISLNDDNGNEVEWFDGAGGSGIPSIAIDYSNSDCDPVAITLNAFILCDDDNDPSTPDVYVDLAVSHTVIIFPSLDELGGVSLINDGGCGPSLDFPCDGSSAYVVTNTYDGNGAYPDFSSENSSGNVNFTISNLDDPFGGSLDFSAVYDCNSCPFVLTPANGTQVFCGIDATDLSDSTLGLSYETTITPTSVNVGYYLTPGATPITPYVVGTLAAFDPCESTNTEVFVYLECDLYGDGFNGGPDDTYITAGSFIVEVYPDLSSLNIVVMDDGACGPYIDSYDCEGTAAYSVVNNYDANGAYPDFSTETMSANISFTITNSTAPVACNNVTIEAVYNCSDTTTPCPSTTDASTSEDICSGEMPNLPNITLTDDNGNLIEWFVNVPNSGTPFTSVNFENLDCKAEVIELNAFILCDQDNDPSTPDVYVDLSYTHTVNVYPIIEATAFADECEVYLEIADCNNFITTWTITAGDNEGTTGNGNTYTAIEGETGEITFNIENEDAISTNVNCISTSSSINFDCPLEEIEEPIEEEPEEPIIEEPIAANKFAIPNAFTPNGDGINDLFRVTGNSIANYELLIYNRWGQLLYNSTNQGWDGSKKGELMNLGVYVYEAIIQYEDGEEAYTRGNVSLIR